eukprot:COSAG02_NODE_13721_length_1357_cov_1.379968_2_plen_137_part_00
MVRGTWYVVRSWYVVRGTWYVVRGTNHNSLGSTLQARLGLHSILGGAEGVLAIHFVSVEMHVIKSDLLARRLLWAYKFRGIFAPGALDVPKVQIAYLDEMLRVLGQRLVVGVDRDAGPCVFDCDRVPRDVGHLCTE